MLPSPAPDLLPAISAFARVAHHASFTRAAAELAVSPSALSQTIRSLEQRLGVRLLNRTTRRVGVTEIGQRFLADAQLGLAALGKAVQGLDETREHPAGLLRINLSRTAANMVVLPHLADFIEAYPDITTELHCDNSFVDLVAGGFDAGIRLGEFLAQDVVALPLGGPVRLALGAAPGYLQRHGTPRTPEALADHRCINTRFASGQVYRWEFARKASKGKKAGTFEMEVSGPVVSNDGDVALSVVRAGGGIGCSFEPLLQADFDSGQLLPVLKAWWPRFTGFHLYHPSRVHVPRKLRVFIDFLQARTGPA